MSKSLGNVIEPRRGHQAVRRGDAAAVGGLGGVQRGRAHLGDHPDAAVGSLPQDAQHVPLRAGQPVGFRPAPPTRCPADELHEIDQWILLRAEDLVARCRAWYEEFAFHRVYQALYDFATRDLSAIYFDVLKDRLYTSAPKSQARRSAQTALYRLADALVRLLAPM